VNATAAVTTLRARRRALALLLAAALLPGCAGSGEERVEVHLANVMLLDAAPLEQRMRLTLRFQNRGNADLTVDGLAYRIEASGTTIASGVSNQVFTVPRYGEARVDVEATSTLAGIVRDVYELQRKSGVQHPRLRYRIQGTANLVAPPMSLGRASSFGFDTVNELPLAAELPATAR
jgi:LEA14-like dessication related protein